MARQRLGHQAAGFGLLDEQAQRRRGRLAVPGGQAHGLLDQHEAPRQQAQARPALGLGLQLLAQTGGDIGPLGQEMLHHRRRAGRVHPLRLAQRARQVQVVAAATAHHHARAGAVDLLVVGQR